MGWLERPRVFAAGARTEWLGLRGGRASDRDWALGAHRSPAVPRCTGRCAIGHPHRSSVHVHAVCGRRVLTAADQALCLRAKELTPAGPIGCGAGPRPTLRSTFATVVAETRSRAPPA